MDRPGDQESELRREFLKKVGKLGVTVPAATLLLAASVTPASAQGGGYGGGSQGSQGSDAGSGSG